MNNNLISFTTLPSVSELLCVNAIIDKRENVKISTYNNVIIKCRQLIFENHDVIAYPELDQSYYVVIVVKENYFSEGKLKNALKKYNLRFNGPPIAATRYIYERCCYYTILTKIAPKWNTIANYFVKGRDFLMNNSPTDCAYLTIRINEHGETSFIYNTGRIKLPTMTMNSLDLPYKHIQSLAMNKFTNVEEYESKTVRVLPSLKKGKIIKISENLTQSQTFSEYKYMKRYWKNTYGYRLPESENNMIYFDIKFFNEFPIFTYPIICVRPYNPVFLKRTNSLDVVNEFISDMIKAAPIILGVNYKTPILSQTDVGLCSATQLLNRQNPLLYTPENHFHPRNISDTQNSAVILLKTQSATQNCITQKNITQNNTISQFVQELHKQEHYYDSKSQNINVSKNEENVEKEKIVNLSLKTEIVPNKNISAENNLVSKEKRVNFGNNLRYKSLDIKIDSKMQKEEVMEKKRKID